MGNISKVLTPSHLCSSALSCSLPYREHHLHSGPWQLLAITEGRQQGCYYMPCKQIGRKLCLDVLEKHLTPFNLMEMMRRQTPKFPAFLQRPALPHARDKPIGEHLKLMDCAQLARAVSQTQHKQVFCRVFLQSEPVVKPLLPKKILW